MSLGMNRTWTLAALVPFLIYAGLSAAQNSTSPGQEQLAKGIAALKAGNLDSAEKIFTLALHQGVRSPLVYHNLGVIAQERGQHEQAVARFRETIRLQPEFGAAHLLLGVSLLALAKNAEAARELKIAEKLMPAEPQVHLQLARAYDALEEHFAAIDQYRQLTRLAPQNPEYVYLLARSWADLSRSSLKEIAKLDSNSVRLHQALSLELWNQGKYEQALSSFQKAADVDPKLPEIHLSQSLIYLEQRKYDEALAEIARELSLVPDSQEALATRAKIAAAKAASAP
ncbi:MAG: tetratricopeptide repeat protein [Terriglobales bacterium]